MLLLGLTNGAIVVYQLKSSQLHSLKDKDRSSIHNVKDINSTGEGVHHENTGEDGMPLDNLDSLEIKENPLESAVTTQTSKLELRVSQKSFILNLIPVHPGQQPPLPHLSSHEVMSNAVVRGSSIRDNSTDTSSSYFAAAWADGRICICAIQNEPSERGDDESTDSSQENNPAFWKVLHCVHTGMSLFRLQFIELSVEIYFPLFIAASHCGKVFFVSTKNLHEDNALQNTDKNRPRNVDFECSNEFSLPATICCFESDTLINRLQPKPSAELGLDLHNLLGIKQSLLLHDFACRK